jgi:hypothetical protein
MEVWDAGEGDIIVLGSNRPWESDTKIFAEAFDLEKVRRGLGVIGLLSPEAILARRMASQRTAFAIAGPGPLQSDESPILEYAAPKTFYIYIHRIGVTCVQRFDERTWQMDLASESDKKDLAKLDPPALKTIFDGDQGSADADLLNYLHGRYAKYTGKGPLRPVMIGNHVMPCSLQGTNVGFGIFTPPSAATNLITRQLAMAEYSLRRDVQKLPAIESIESTLNSVTDYSPQGADWSPAYYADLAIKAALQDSEPDRARTILLRGLQLEPGSDQLHYLSRILLRQGILQSSDIAMR